MTTKKENQLEFDFEDIKEKLYVIEDNGDYFKLDFDNNKKFKKNFKNGVLRADFSQPPTNKKNIERNSEMERRNEQSREDLTEQQVEENYWNKIDGSTNMMEARISKMMEATGKSREECSKEVKTRMKKQGSENTNTDMKKKEEEEETEDEEEEKIDTISICPKEYDMLLAKSKELDTLKKEKEALSNDLDTFKKDLLELKKEYEAKKAADIEAKRQDIIERLSKDFIVPKETFKNDSLEELQKSEKLLELAIKKDTKEVEIKEDMQDHFNLIEQRAKDLEERYIQRF